MYLSLSFVALALGPLLVWIAKSQPWSTVSIDSFCLVTVSGFALLHLLPESAAQAGDIGWLVLPLALLGFVLPSLAERTLHHGHRGMRRTVLLLAFLGIAAHATLDGFFLASDGTVDIHGHTYELTAWAIILHRVPEGVGIWWIVPRTLGFLPAVLVSIVSVLATLFGYFVGDALLTDTSQRGLALMQSLLVGSLLHVVLHAHVPAPRQQGRFKIVSVLGGALGVWVLWNVIHDHFPRGDHGSPAEVFVQLAMESAPALLLAYLLVGLCHAFLPANWLRRMTQGPPFLQALRGVAVGLPLPVCSCGVVPIYRELIRQGTAIAAAIAFLVATPELELAAVMLTWQLMGGEVALARVLMAAALALGVGVLVGALASKAHKVVDGGDAGAMPESTSGPLWQRLVAAVRFGFGPAVDNTATWILTGLLLSALLMPYVDREWIAALPAGLDVPVAALIGLPLYICATGSTPLAAMLLAQGLSPGAVLALMLTGPATNVTTFGVLAKLHGGKVATVFAVAMGLGAIGLGYLANWLLPTLQRPNLGGAGHTHGTFGWIALGALAAVFLFALLRQGMRPFLERLFESPANLAHGEAKGCCPGEADDGHDHAHHAGHHHHHGGPAAPTAPTAPVFTPAAASPLAPPAPPDGGGCCGHRH
ncbi:MAG: permease [Planctomycetes bacterium]|nr:permease [Planctomycetota bacterium]